MRCLSCRYDLKNLTEHCCPECGREFDPYDATTIDDGPRRFSRYVSRAVRVLLWIAGSCAIVLAVVWLLALLLGIIQMFVPVF